MAECGCSGIRSCLICESRKGKGCIETTEENVQESLASLVFCLVCQRPFSGPLCGHKNSLTTDGFVLDGVRVVENFITKDEELFILSEIEKFPWRISQSGRMKQDFGPKVNFKKKKVNCGRFTGLPSFSQFFVKRLQQSVPELSNFNPVELCNLDYCPERGAAIDPHIDDRWLWGEHLVTINLLSSTILTLTDLKQTSVVSIPLPQYSLVILKGDSRHNWMHAIKRSDIQSRRIAVTLRELSEEFMSGVGYEEIGKHLLKLAASYNGTPSS